MSLPDVCAACAGLRVEHTCQPTAAPGEDARAEAREQIAEWLFDRVTTRDRITREIWPNLPEPIRVGWREWADHLLAAVPAIAEALAAAENVRDLIVDLDRRGRNAQGIPELRLVGNAYVGTADRLRRALGEDAR